MPNPPPSALAIRLLVCGENYKAEAVTIGSPPPGSSSECIQAFKQSDETFRGDLRGYLRGPTASLEAAIGAPLTGSLLRATSTSPAAAAGGSGGGRDTAAAWRARGGGAGRRSGGGWRSGAGRGGGAGGMDLPPDEMDLVLQSLVWHGEVGALCSLTRVSRRLGSLANGALLQVLLEAHAGAPAQEQALWRVCAMPRATLTRDGAPEVMARLRANAQDEGVRGFAACCCDRAMPGP